MVLELRLEVRSQQLKVVCKSDEKRSVNLEINLLDFNKFIGVAANGGADLRPVARSYGGGGARLDAFESEGFETSLAISISLNQGLDIIARGGVVTRFDFGLEVGREAFWEGNGEGVHGV